VDYRLTTSHWWGRTGGVVGVPPPKKGRRQIERKMQHLKPGPPELRLEAEPPSGPFRRKPDRKQHDSEDRDDLAPKNLGRGHGTPPSEIVMKPLQLQVLFGRCRGRVRRSEKYLLQRS
jgi:hypothetical protein